jgi:hypothetical protein
MYLDGSTNAEIAEALGVKITTVKKRVVRGSWFKIRSELAAIEYDRWMAEQAIRQEKNKPTPPPVPLALQKVRPEVAQPPARAQITINTVLRFNVSGGQEACLHLNSDSVLTEYAWQLLQARLQRQCVRSGWFHGVVALDWSCVRTVHTQRGLERQRFQGARRIQTSCLIEAKADTLNALILAVHENENALNVMPTYDEARIIYHDDGSIERVPLARLHLRMS